jgi:hypothetical protein
MFNELTKALASAAKQYGLISTNLIAKSYVGLAELRQLIDLDTISSPNIDIAEGHHLAWCIGRICAVRPGSVGPTDATRERSMMYLTWRDVDITTCA